MENENLTENNNTETNQSGAAEAPQPNTSNPIAGGIVSQMAIQENVAVVAESGGDLAGDQSLNAESGEASMASGGADSDTTGGAEQEK